VPGAIALAPAGNGRLNDGLLTAGEILDMKLSAELVVLSACDTSGNFSTNGKPSEANGLKSLGNQ